MNSFLAIILESGISLIMFYALYYFVLQRDTFFVRNRLFLLGSVLFSFVLPFIQIPLQTGNTYETYQILLNTIQISEDNLYTNAAQTTSWSIVQLLGIVYITGVLVLSVRFIVQVLTIVKLICTGEATTYKNKRVVVIHRALSSFSFFNYIFISRDQINKRETDKILEHEYAHIKQLHSIDNLLLEFAIIFQWFNPAIWMLRKALKETHEYLADVEILEQGFSRAKYQLLLLNHTVGYQMGMTNNFNHSLTLKRLHMMKKEKSKQVANLKVFLLIPVVIFIMGVFACTDDTKLAEDTELQEQITEKSANDEAVYQDVDVMPEFPGGNHALRQFVARNVKYPQVARDNGIHGKIFVYFVVTKTGKVDRVSIKRSIDTADLSDVTVVGYKGEPDKLVDASIKSLEEEAMRVISGLPDWKPGKNSGKPVNVEFVIPINFALQ